MTYYHMSIKSRKLSAGAREISFNTHSERPSPPEAPEPQRAEPFVSQGPGPLLGVALALTCLWGRSFVSPGRRAAVARVGCVATERLQSHQEGGSWLGLAFVGSDAWLTLKLQRLAVVRWKETLRH